MRPLLKCPPPVRAYIFPPVLRGRIFSDSYSCTQSVNILTKLCAKSDNGTSHTSSCMSLNVPVPVCRCMFLYVVVRSCSCMSLYISVCCCMFLFLYVVVCSCMSLYVPVPVCCCTFLYVVVCSCMSFYVPVCCMSCMVCEWLKVWPLFACSFARINSLTCLALHCEGVGGLPPARVPPSLTPPLPQPFHHMLENV